MYQQYCLECDSETNHVRYECRSCPKNPHPATGCIVCGGNCEDEDKWFIDEPFITEAEFNQLVEENK
ncbi:MAG TPA: hypothetical protein PKY82_25435, partial [Pyrinomonadaceae bacterium]|nr:hypothetical protein [Pyrinomonadaceae bacterium]